MIRNVAHVQFLQIWLWILLCLAVCISCRPKSDEPIESGEGAFLRAWAHAGREAERKTLESQVKRFNQSHPGIHIALTLLPEGSYNSQIQAAALADDLPDLLEFDGPFVYNYVWQGHLISLDHHLSDGITDRLLPSILEQGTYRDSLYSLGMYDSGLGLYARRSLLDSIGARIPDSPDTAWSVDEFESILARLAQRDPDGAVLDLKLNYRGEWFTYAFSPAIQSGGGDLIRRRDYQSATSVLNGPEAVEVMRYFQIWIHDKEYVDANVDDNAFVGGRVALSWVGHWEYRRYHEAFGNDLVILPLPDFGHGSRTGQGSWNWGITTLCPRPGDAVRFLEFLLQDRQVLRMSNANAAVPATSGAIEASSLYGKNNPLRLFAVQLTGGFSVPRPRTPAYPVITTTFQQAFDDIRNGADVQTALDQAVEEINQDIHDNQGYPNVR
jgi:multiple sugar transport system substrate-binding protein